MDSGTSDPRLRIGISTCLLGEQVRFDGGHKRDSFLVDTLGRYVEWVRVCPEVEVGMGTPREPVRLVRPAMVAESAHGVHMIGVKSGSDWTDRMARYAGRRVSELERLDLSGYVLKKDSPSCGLARVKVYDASGSSERSGTGLFAAALRARFPSLPIEEEGRLQDPRLRENFITRIFAYRRVRVLFAARWSAGDLVRFHTAHKLLLLAHEPRAYTELGRLVAAGPGQDRRQLRATYEARFMTALARIATPQRHANVLMHIAGYFRGRLDEDSRKELLEVIEEHRRGVAPLIVPLTLVRHHVRRLGIEYLQGQVYLDPHPRELALRNHVAARGATVASHRDGRGARIARRDDRDAL